MGRIFGLFHKKKELIAAESVTEQKQNVTENAETEREQKVAEVTYLDNPLPVPKKHEKRSMDFALNGKTDDFDISIDENDDFDV